MGYWDKREQLKRHAVAHTEEMELHFWKEIADSVAQTKVYDEDFKGKDYKNTPTVIIDDKTSTNAACEYEDGVTCILNFASFKHPGGMFIEGSSAQEESLCHESFLYNVIKEQTDFYDKNNNMKNRSLYKDRALYSPNIRFKNSEGYIGYFDVLTCAAPNFTSAQKYCGVTQAENSQVLDQRIKYIIDIINDNNVDVAILGAWGCGVFGQNPTEVAALFKRYIDLGKLNVKTVVFAIPAGPNLDAFKRIFN